MHLSRSTSWLVLMAAAGLGCGGEQEYAVRFAARVGGQPLRCGTEYPDIGLTRTTIRLLDFKAYVRELTLVRANGERHPLVLEQDGRWQRDDIALLDFEDGTGDCDTGSPETRTEVVGRAPAFADYRGLELKLGLPPERNHLDGATAPAPLNAPGMWWSWKGGYKFVRLDVRSAGNPVYHFHLGASGCEGSPAEGYRCREENQLLLSLPDFDPRRHRLVFDLAALYADADLDRAVDSRTDHITGCMSSGTDPECAPLFRRLGLGDAALPPGTPDSFLRVE